ncbi:MAG: glucose-6-phosphate dehydrogenase [Candidatus Saccharimonadaceae bacterium]
MAKFDNKYRIPSARLKGWDYSSFGANFITICTHNLQPFFGEIKEDGMSLNKIGEIAESHWLSIADHFPFITLYSFVIMPNHVHGILVLNESDESNKVGVRLEEFSSQKSKQMSEIYPISWSISTIIRSYKSTLTKDARGIDKGFS